MVSDEKHKRRGPDVIHSELVGGTEQRELAIMPYDPDWPIRFRSEQDRITGMLGDLALMVEHIGSTSVPGLAAKPIIDILLTVPDITAEEEYIDPLLVAGYELRVREPGHRMVRTPALDVHVHIHESEHPDVEAYLFSARGFEPTRRTGSFMRRLSEPWLSWNGRI